MSSSIMYVLMGVFILGAIIIAATARRRPVDPSYRKNKLAHDLKWSQGGNRRGRSPPPGKQKKWRANQRRATSGSGQAVPSARRRHCEARYRWYQPRNSRCGKRAHCTSADARQRARTPRAHRAREMRHPRGWSPGRLPCTQITFTRTMRTPKRLIWNSAVAITERQCTARSRACGIAAVLVRIADVACRSCSTGTRSAAHAGKRDSAHRSKPRKRRRNRRNPACAT